jgi:hypothetical protein
MYRKKYCLTALFVTVVTLSAINFREGQSQDKFIWIGGGVETLVTADGSLYGINASLNYTKNDRIYKFRGLLAAELVVAGPRPNEEVWELGLLYGLHSTYGMISVSYLAGISYTGGIYRGDRLYSDMFDVYYEELTFETFGLPLEIQFDINKARPFGLSLSAFSNINAENSFAGLSLNLLLGRLP